MINDWSGLHILVTRPGAAGDELCNSITARGGKAMHFPVIAFAPPVDQAAFMHAIESLGRQDWVIFNSPQSVRAAVPAMRSVWPNFPETVKLVAVGAGTAYALREAGYLAALMPESDWSTEGLLALPEFEFVSDKNIMVVRGAGGRELLDKVLRERGADVTTCIAYRRILPVVNAAPCAQLVREHKLNLIVAGSFESVSNLQLLLGKDITPQLVEIPLVVMSERIKKLAAESGFQTIWVTQTASQQAVLDLISDKKEVLCQIHQKK